MCLLLARLPPGSGRPTGLAVDAEGGVWTALCDGRSHAPAGVRGPAAAVEATLPRDPADDDTSKGS